MVVLYTPPVTEKISRTGFTFGFRLGIGFPGGMVAAAQASTGSTGNASDAFGVMLPVTVDVGYRLSPHWYVGGYASAAYATSANCGSEGTATASCSETVYRFGLDAQYRLLPDHTWQPWIGVGAGWEVANQYASDPTDGDTASSADGVEFAHIDLGIDYRISERQKVGPYFMTTFADYDNGYVHEWYIVGVRWHFDTNWSSR